MWPRLAGAAASFLLPPGLGPNAWRSPTFRSAARAMDSCALCFAVAFNGLLFKMGSRLPPLPAYVDVIPEALHVAIMLLLYAWCHRRPEQYFRYRHVVQLCHRCLLLTYMPLLPIALRLLSSSPRHIAHLAATVSNPYPLWSAFTFTLGVSGTIHMILHSVVVPLPFLPQLLFQSLYLALGLVHTQPAVACLEASPYGPELLTICDTVSRAVALLLSAVSGVSVGTGMMDHVCSAHGPLLLVVFTNVFFGFVLPVYVAFRMEQHFTWYVRRFGLRDGALGPGSRQQRRQQQQQPEQEQEQQWQQQQQQQEQPQCQQQQGQQQKQEQQQQHPQQQQQQRQQQELRGDDGHASHRGEHGRTDGGNPARPGLRRRGWCWSREVTTGVLLGDVVVLLCLAAGCWLQLGVTRHLLIFQMGM